MGDGRGEGSSALENGELAAISLTLDVDGTQHGSQFWKFSTWSFVCTEFIVPLKHYTPWSSCICPRDARIFQYQQISQCNIPH